MVSRSLIKLLLAINVLCGASVLALGEEQLPVIELRFETAANAAAVTQNNDPPELVIYPDGTVQVHTSDRTATARISSQQLGELIRDLTERCRLHELRSEQIRADVQAEGIRLGLSSWIPGAEDTVIRIRQADRLIDLRCHAAGLMITRFPDVRSLRQVMAAQERLQNIRALVLLGDGRQAAALAERASASLQEQLPGAAPLTTRDLSMVHTLSDGTRLIQFSRRDSQSGSPEGQLVIVSLMESPGQQLRVTVMAGDSVVR